MRQWKSLQVINVLINNHALGTYKHVATEGERLFVYDIECRKCVGSLGEFDVHHW